MAVLPGQEIESEIKAGHLIRNAKLENIEACSYDMRIGTFFLNGQIINAAHGRATEQIILQPGDVLSMFTEEELDLPPGICGTAFPLNSQSSRGLLVLNPGHIDPGFRGPLTVKVLNVRRVPMAVTRGTKIFTVIFERLSAPASKPYGRFHSREDREREFNSTDVEVAPRSLSELIVVGRDAPFTTQGQVRELILRHWASWVVFVLTFAAALAAVLGVVIQ